MSSKAWSTVLFPEPERPVRMTSWREALRSSFSRRWAADFALPRDEWRGFLGAAWCKAFVVDFFAARGFVVAAKLNSSLFADGCWGCACLRDTWPPCGG